jgi:hypothetical protein
MYNREASMSNRNREIAKVLSRRRKHADSTVGALNTLNRVFRYAARSCYLPVGADVRIADDTAPKYASASVSEAAAKWDPSLAAAWTLFNREKGARAFSIFLAKLRDAENNRSDPDFPAAVVALPKRLSEHQNLRDRCFAISHGALSNRGDSALMAFNRMASVRMSQDIEAGFHDRRPETVIAHIRQLFR